MSVEQHQQALLTCYNSTNDSELQFAIKEANDYTELMKGGQISKEEYIELMQDIQRKSAIKESVDNQQLLIHMHTAINGLISLASLV